MIAASLNASLVQRLFSRQIPPETDYASQLLAPPLDRELAAWWTNARP